MKLSIGQERVLKNLFNHPGTCIHTMRPDGYAFYSRLSAEIKDRLHIKTVIALRDLGMLDVVRSDWRGSKFIISSNGKAYIKKAMRED